MTWIFDNAGGRKFLLVALAIVGVVVLTITDDVTGAQALDSLVWLVGIGAGSIALEDGLAGLRGKGEADDGKA